MRIYSKFHDYYDTALGFGIDPDCHYIRKTSKHDKGQQGIYNLQEVEHYFSRAPYPGSYNRTQKYGDGIADIQSKLLLVVGKMYPILVIKTKSKNGVLRDHVIQSVEDLDLLISKYLGKRGNAKYANQKNKAFSVSWRYDHYSIMNRRHMVAFFNQFEGSPEDQFLDTHYTTEVPVLLITADELVYNPRLKPYQFFRILPPYQAFQEISMFISGVLGGKSPKMIEISDEIRLQKHGFDLKTSFRKDKENAA